MIKKINSTALFLFFIITSICSAVKSIDKANKDHPFANIFTSDLYRLDIVNEYDIPPAPEEMKLKLGASHEEKDNESKLKRLQTRKHNQVTKKLILPMEDDLATLSKFDRKKLLEIVLRAAATSVSTTTTSILYPRIEPVSTNLVLLCNATTFCAQVTTEAIILRYLGNEKIQSDNIDVNFLKKQLIKDIDNEEVILLEKKYIDDMDSYKDRKVVIENLLLDTRKRESSISNSVSPIEKLTDILNFPLKTLSLPPNFDGKTPADFGDKATEFIDQIFKKTLPNQFTLNYYHQDVQKNLKKAMINICRSSQHALKPESSGIKRRFLMLYGEPGSGKTAASKLIADELCLPIYEFQLNDKNALSKDNLCGASGFKAQKGEYPLALLTPNKAGDRCKNLIIRINDIDRIFEKDPKTEKLKDVKGFMHVLLRLFDLEQPYIDAAYYGIRNFDISQVHFICTTNTDFKAMHDEVKDQKAFEAFNDRLDMIKFLPLDAETQKQNIKRRIQKTDFDLSLAYANKNEKDQNYIREAIANFIVNYYNPNSNRVINRMIEDLLDTPLDQWEKLAQDNEWVKMPKEEQEDEGRIQISENFDFLLPSDREKHEINQNTIREEIFDFEEYGLNDQDTMQISENIYFLPSDSEKREIDQNTIREKITDFKEF